MLRVGLQGLQLQEVEAGIRLWQSWREEWHSAGHLPIPWRGQEGGISMGQGNTARQAL